VPDLAGVLRAVHAVVGVWFMAGLIGRWIVLAQAARASDLPAMRAVLAVSSRFERIVISGSLAVLVLGVATAIAQGRPFLGPLQGAGFDWLFASVLLFVSVIPLIPLVFIPRGRVFENALEEATAAGAVTDRLRLTFRDPVVFAAHVYELGAMTIVLVLMIMKPF
jgi:predicted integral membrane protein DUF2269